MFQPILVGQTIVVSVQASYVTTILVAALVGKVNYFTSEEPSVMATFSLATGIFVGQATGGLGA